MKKYILSAFAVLSAATLFTSCNDMLDTDPRKTEVTDAVFPGKVADVESELSATYAIMNTMGGGDSDNQNIWYWWEIMSDNCYGSGGLQDNKVKSLHHLVEMSVNQFASMAALLVPLLLLRQSTMCPGERIRSLCVISSLARLISCVVFITSGSASCLVTCL